MRYATASAILIAFCGSVTCAERAAYDSTSRIIALLSDAEALQVSSSVGAVIPSGRRIPVQRGARRLLPALTWTQDFALPAGGALFTFNESRAFTNIIKVRGNAQLSADGQTVKGTQEVVLMDRDGKVIATIPGATFTGTRLTPEITGDFHDFQNAQ